jgi:hypothetical protein
MRPEANCEQTDEAKKLIAIEYFKVLRWTWEHAMEALRQAFPDERAVYTDDSGNRHDVTLILDFIRAKEIGIPCRFANGNLYDKRLSSITRKVGE